MIFQDGFLVKSIRAKGLIVDDVVPKIDELRTFEFVQKEEDNGENYNLIQTLKETNQNKRKFFVKGDKIKIIKGALQGITGVVESVQNENIQIRPDIIGYTDILEYSSDYLIKQFSPGDNIKVVSGSNVGKYGLIVKVEDHIAVVFSEDTLTEFSVNVQDIVLSSQSTFETGKSIVNSGFAMDDLVKITG
jgi:transcription elongation factor SPT5